MLPSAQLGFHLQPLLEQLHQDELSKFKALLRTLSLKDEFQHISLTEVEEADGKQLAEILTNRCPSCWVETVTIQVFDKMNRTDLSERAKDEFRGKQKQAHTLSPVCPLPRIPEGKQDKYRNTLKKKFGQIGKNLRPGPSENVHIAPQRCEALIPFCNPKMLAGPFPHTAVLQGPAGAGRTTPAERPTSLNDQHILPFWVDLCSVFDSNRNLTFLDISQSFLSTSSVRVLCEKIASAASSLQKVILKNLSPADAYRNICLALGGLETLTHLTFQGNDQDDLLPPLCEVLRHPKCNLQYLRLASCSATTEQWATLSSCLKISQSLTCLNLTANEFPGEAAKGLCRTLSHPKCFLQRLSLENCHLTEANCKELSSALIVSQRLTHLCLAKNALGDRGVKLLCEGLSYPECQLQTLVLWCCSIASGGCFHLSKLLRQNSRLTHLDLGLNHIGITGLKFLCESLKKPLCNLRCLWLWGCAISPVCCADLSSALQSNQNLITLDLGQNFLGYSGIKMLCDALKLQSCPLRTVRLKIDESVFRIRKLLEEIKESNPQLTIESDHQGPKHSRPSSRDFIF
nr:NACHT, LRR and PYD domains-containing protein 2 [Vicugna pacos]